MRSRMTRALRLPVLWVGLAVAGLLIGVGSSSVAAPLAKAPRSLAAEVKRALKLGKSADRKARKALAEAKKARSQAGPGPQGPVGAQGPQGAAGAAGAPGRAGSPGKAGSGLGYAQIEYCAAPPCEDFNGIGWFSSDDTNSPGIDNTVNFQTSPAPPAGVFCYHDLPFKPHVVMATIGTMGDASTTSIPYLVQGRAGSTEHPLSECPFPSGVDPAKTAAVFVRDMTGATVDPSHSLRVFVLFG
jgi:hypothetical protein